MTPWLTLAVWSGVGQDLQVGVRVHVDEAGRESQPGRRRSSAGRLRKVVADSHDPPAVDGDVGGESRGAGAVDDGRPGDQQLSHGSVRSRSNNPGCWGRLSGGQSSEVGPDQVDDDGVGGIRVVDDWDQSPLVEGGAGCDRPTRSSSPITTGLPRRTAGSRAGRSAWSPSSRWPEHRFAVRARPDQLRLGHVLIAREVPSAGVEDRQARLGLRGDPDPPVHGGDQSARRRCAATAPSGDTRRYSPSSCDDVGAGAQDDACIVQRVAPAPRPPARSTRCRRR